MSQNLSNSKGKGGPYLKIRYIEFRIYLKDGIDEGIVLEAADQIQDKIANYVSESDECTPAIFTQDVTYELK